MFLGFYTKGETVRCWANYVDGNSSPVVPANPRIWIYQGGTAIVNGAAVTQLAPGSNLFFYDYTVGAVPIEGTLEVIHRGEIDGVVSEGADHFAINLIKSHVLENRLGNQRILFFPATVQNVVRNVEIGVLDYQTIETKDDAAPDWSSPTSSKTLWFWYESLGEINPVKVGENG